MNEKHEELQPDRVPRFLPGESRSDARGNVSFVNQFDPRGMVRFYRVENSSTDVVRAWIGHCVEAKAVFAAAGRAVVAAVRFGDPESPDRSATVHRFLLDSAHPAVVRIPPGHANGFRALEEGTILIFFSSLPVGESARDDYRFPPDCWGQKVWDIAGLASREAGPLTECRREEER